MTDLDELIRSTLHEHTPVTAPDDGLADRVQTTGRRIRRTRSAAGAALALVVVAGLAWGATVLPRVTHPSIAASPMTNQPTNQATNQASSGPLPSPSTSVRDVSEIGAPSERDHQTFLVSDFASPDGTLHCFISTAGAGCQGEEWAAGVKPSRKICNGEGAVLGPELWGREAAAWACGTDPHSIPVLGGGGEVAWWDSGFGGLLPMLSDPLSKLAILPPGRVLVAGDFSCSTTIDAVACSNSRTGEGFHASRAEVTLQP